MAALISPAQDEAKSALLATRPANTHPSHELFKALVRSPIEGCVLSRCDLSFGIRFSSARSRSADIIAPAPPTSAA